MPLGNPDPSSHADLITSFDRAVTVRMFPFTRHSVVLPTEPVNSEQTGRRSTSPRLYVQ